MQKELKFALSGKTFSGPPVKLEREKIYGRSEIIASDRNGNKCVCASLDPEGTLIIPAGAVKPGLLSESGEWIEKNTLCVVDENGQTPQRIASSFDGEIVLSETAALEDFVDHIWKAVYMLDIPGLAELIGDVIYRFPFSYRGGFSADDGFLLVSGGRCWLFVGEGVDFPFIGISEEGVLDDAETAETVESDEIDFNMM